MTLADSPEGAGGCVIQLEVHGRASREAARRRKSEWKVNLDIQTILKASFIELSV